MTHPMYHVARRYMGMPVEIVMVSGERLRCTICNVTPDYVNVMPLPRGVSNEDNPSIDKAQALID